MHLDLGKIWMICRKPCVKCIKSEQVLKQALRELELENEVKYVYEFIKITDLRKAERFSANVSSTPFVIIDGHLVFAGVICDVSAAKHTLLNIIRHRHLPFKSLYNYSSKGLESDLL